MKYRFSKKFGEKRQEAFLAVKQALLDLVVAAKDRNFKAVDENPLSQLFKAKIISLYFPDLYLNVCSSEHLENIAGELGIDECSYSSEYQHLLLLNKKQNQVTRKWSNPKYMAYLYAKYIHANLNAAADEIIKKPRKNTNRRVNFEDIHENRDAIGKKSEKFAFEWEKNRLIGLGYPGLAKRIEDRRDKPSYGYDFLSFSSPEQQRFIEVKSVGKDKKEGCYRFFLSDNEYEISKSNEHSGGYYFYLVFYGGDGEPVGVSAIKADTMYLNSQLSSCAYIVRFDYE